MRRSVEATALAKEPYLVWNAFVDLVASEDYESLTRLQRVAHLAFWYDAEVRNGGHLQYFLNSAGAHRHVAIDALVALGLTGHADILRRATAAWDSKPREEVETVDEFVNEALENEFGEYDGAYYDSLPDVDKALESYLAEHQEEFVIVLPAS